MRNKIKKINRSLLIIGSVVLVTFVAIVITSKMSELPPRQLASVSPKEDYYLSKVQPIFNNRCITCHSCFNSPCQLNLTSFSGLDRGAIKDDVYDFNNFEAKSPTRLGIDVPESSDWRWVTSHWRDKKYIGSNGKLGFTPVVNRGLPELKRLENSLLFQMILLRKDYLASHSDLNSRYKNYFAEQSRGCPLQPTQEPNNDLELKSYKIHFPWAGMPYGFPELKDDEILTLTDWIASGSNPPDTNVLESLNKPSHPEILKLWEDFLNQNDFAHKITARYIYEHLFLAHIYFENSPGEFYRLIRATCVNKDKKENCQELPTRRPTDDPLTSEFYNSAFGPMIYKFQKVTQTLVHKSHIPFELNDKKFEKWNSIFIKKISSSKKKRLPKYGDKAAGNPFETFKDIPLESRYQFLLDDSYFFVMSFIKGPVCRGAAALSVIDDHFWVFFLNPKSDITIKHSEFYKEANEYLATPVSDGNYLSLMELINDRSLKARKIKQKYINKYLDNGFSLNDIWNGDSNSDGIGENPNAVLTIYRHNESASVSRGAIGEAPKTMWLMDYPIFEDIYYNLVGTYDVYSPITHSIASRWHMDSSRFNSQDLFLSFLPLDQRGRLRNQWTKDKNPNYKAVKCNLPSKLCAYKNRSAVTMRDVVYPYSGSNSETQIVFKDKLNADKEFAYMILKYLTPSVTGSTDETLNKIFDNVYNKLEYSSLTRIEQIFAKFSGRQGLFASVFPELSFIQVTDNGKDSEWYTLIHNREKYNVAFINTVIDESERLWPEKDSLNVVKGFVGSYANAIFSVERSKLYVFANDILRLTTDPSDLTQFYKKYLVSRHNPNFWDYFDDMMRNALKVKATKQSDPYEGSYIDLNRYINDDGGAF